MTNRIATDRILAAFERRDAAHLARRTLYCEARIEAGAYAILERVAFSDRPIHNIDLNRVRRIAAQASLS
jgi:hypothetical protein